MKTHNIPLEVLDTQKIQNNHTFSKSLMENEINGVHVEHLVISTNYATTVSTSEGCKTIYLFIKGTGEVKAGNLSFEIVPETIFLPNAVDSITIKATHGKALHYLKITCELSAQDVLDLQELPTENVQNCYYTKFIDCQPYTEAIKSPNTVSRTILSNEFIPRVAMGTVQTRGPDKVAPHEHPMLEQLFLGLSGNQCVVYADDNKVDFPEHSVVHIPLGSNHSVSVEEHKIMYYVWMDFFMDKKGEEWLKTHQVEADQL